MSYKNTLFLRNILSEKEIDKIIKFNESRKLSLYRDDNIRACIFDDTNLANKLKFILKKNGFWDEGAVGIMNKFILINYYDMLPKCDNTPLIRKKYTQTRTFLQRTGREILIMLDSYNSDDHTKYLLSTNI